MIEAPDPALRSWVGGVLWLVQSILLFLFPVSVVTAVLRYRLWDIDVIINRALVYGILTAVLLGAYVGAIIVNQRSGQ